jgi:hypothetical protein
MKRIYFKNWVALLVLSALALTDGGCFFPSDRRPLSGMRAVKPNKLPSEVVVTCRGLFPDKEIVRAYRCDRSGGKERYFVWLGSSGREELSVILTGEGVLIDGHH